MGDLDDRTERVSVIVPVFDGAEVLAGALASIRAQHHRPHEVIVVDDGSTDATADVIAAEAVAFGNIAYRSHHQANAGPSAARNTGLGDATGEFVAFLDADDWWPSDSLARLVESVRSSPGRPYVQGLVEHVWPDLGVAVEAEPPMYGFQVGAALFRREALEAIGGFDDSLRFGEDVDLFVRLRAVCGPGRRIDHVTLHYHRRLVDAIDGRERHLRGLTRAVKRALDLGRRIDPDVGGAAHGGSAG